MRHRGTRTSSSANEPCTSPECGRGRPRTSQCSASSRCADLPVRTGLRGRPGCGRGRPRTSQCSASSWCAGLPVRTGLRGRPRTRTSAHLAVFGVVVVRGPPGRTHLVRACGRAPAVRTRTSAHLAVFGVVAVRRRSVGRGRDGLPVRRRRCADLGIGPWQAGMRDEAPRSVRRRRGAARPPGPQWASCGRGCGRGRPRTSQCSASSRSRTCAGLGRSASRGSASRSVAADRDADRTSAHAVFGVVAGARTSRSALGFVAGRDADEDVRAPRSVRRRRGARTSRSALGFRAVFTSRSGMRTRTSAHLAGSVRRSSWCADLRGRPRPHRVVRGPPHCGRGRVLVVRAGVRRRASAYL